MMTAGGVSLDSLGTSAVVIDRHSGEVLRVTGPLFAGHPDVCVGRDWRDALDIPPDQQAVLLAAIEAGCAATLPPTILLAGQEPEVLAAGQLVPQNFDGRAAMLLLLRELCALSSADFMTALGDGDTAGVLGLDGLEYSPNRGLAFLDGLMMELRSAARKVLRDQDLLGIPSGASLPIILRQVEPTEALDICRALLSHLHTLLSERAGEDVRGRASIGLARREEPQGALATFVAANNALGQAQRSIDPERIHFAGPWDQFGLVIPAVTAGGLFADRVQQEERGEYLQQLVTLADEECPAAAYPWRLLRLTLRQPGVASGALFRREYDGHYSFLTAGICDEEGPRKITERQLPRALRGVQKLLSSEGESGRRASSTADARLRILTLGEVKAPLACLVLYSGGGDTAPFEPGLAALQHLASELAHLPGWDGRRVEQSLEGQPLESGIEGYVLDNMEGAIDQAMFLARVDMPVAIVGPRGTGKMYVAQVIQREAGAAPDDLVRIDCREFRSRGEAIRRLTEVLEDSEGKTLVFKSPHLMHADAQVRLARQLSTRTLADSGTPRYLPRARYVALFPDDLEHLVQRGGLEQRLASVFAGHPIHVPPIRDRKRAVMRWAHKILEQESQRQDRRVLGFTPDAEQALLQHNWPGNISEMRELIRAALGRTEKEWLTPVDLGLYRGISAGGSAPAGERPFLQVAEEPQAQELQYQPDAQEALRVALGVALDAMLQGGAIKPLGLWLDDEVILAACDRYRADSRGAAEFLVTRARNISRWMPKVLGRDHERNGSLLWQEPRKLVHQWVRESARLEQPPQQLLQDMLLSHVLQQCGDISVADRARIMGVSTPTYQKRLKQLLQDA